jgi:hypothetical protein
MVEHGPRIVSETQRGRIESLGEDDVLPEIAEARTYRESIRAATAFHKEITLA